MRVYQNSKVWIWMAVSNKGDRVEINRGIGRLVLSAEIRFALRPNALFGQPKPRDGPLPNRQPQSEVGKERKAERAKNVRVGQLFILS